jgi:hypothetical protein
MSLVISKVFTYDTDAGNYIQAVEAADGQALEPATRQAINNFVIGCKQDGIWNAIKASCILSGARTLNGALQPLVGTAPTNFNFVSGDYNRKTGLVGDGSSKYLNSNRNNNADPQNNAHLAFHVSVSPSATDFKTYAGGNNAGSLRQIQVHSPATALESRCNQSGGGVSRNAGQGLTTGLKGISRNDGAFYTQRTGGASATVTVASSAAASLGLVIFAGQSTAALVSEYINARLAFYSIGESLDLALLDARVTALITAFGVAIP